MQFLGEITENGKGVQHDEDTKYSLRRTVRAILFDNKGRIALLYNSKRQYHKLPGGAIESNETYINALRREVLEETGCVIKQEKPIGMVVEYKTKQNIVQVSYGYLGTVVTDNYDPRLTKVERAQGFVLKWVRLAEAIKILKYDIPQDYMGQFIRIRELKFLLKAITMIKNKKLFK